MQKHFEYLIVGMNPNSVLIGQVLQQNGKEFAIYGTLEDAEWPGFEPICITDPTLAGAFQSLCPSNLTEISQVRELPLRQKGEWKNATTELLASLPPSINLAISARRSNFAAGAKELLSEIAKGFNFVDSDEFSYRNLDLNKKELQCGKKTFSFDRLVWCRPLEDLKDLSVDGVKEIGKANRETRIECWMPLQDLDESFPADFLLSFRFKEDHFHAFCSVSTSEGNSILRCTVSLPEELAEQSEETTKILRALVRELKKEFVGKIPQEAFSRVLSYPFVPKEGVAKIGSYEIAKDLFCFLPDLITRGQNAPESYLERAVEQSSWLQKLMKNSSISV